VALVQVEAVPLAEVMVQVLLGVTIISKYIVHLLLFMVVVVVEEVVVAAPCIQQEVDNIKISRKAMFIAEIGCFFNLLHTSFEANLMLNKPFYYILDKYLLQ
jgi:hypothetical protein